MNLSLQRKLLIGLLSATLISWSVVAVASYYSARREINSLFDAHLEQAARVLFTLISNELYEQYARAMAQPDNIDPRRLAEIELHLERHKYEKELAFQFTVGSKFRFWSASAPASPLSDAREGFSSSTLDGQRWRVYTMRDDHDIIVLRVGERYAGREMLIDQIALRTLIPSLTGMAILTVIIWRTVGASLAPLQRLAVAIRRRDPGNLEPISLDHVPSELAPIVLAINRLFGRLGNAFDNERRFTSDAAHELRTPLAGLKTQAQVALRATTDQSRHHALQQIERGVDHAGRLVEQMLTLARLDPESALQQFTEVDLASVTDNAVREIEPLALARDIGLRMRAETPVFVRGHAHTLGILVRNLVDNAVRYTPAGGTVTASVARSGGHDVLVVTDDGPGIPAADRDKVFHRFYRVTDNRTQGSGLGLSIVRRIAELHHAEVRLDDVEPHGLQVQVSFPPG